MTQWEYLNVLVPFGKLVPTLNRYGREGWEAVQHELTEPDETGRVFYDVIMKRPKTNTLTVVNVIEDT